MEGLPYCASSIISKIEDTCGQIDQYLQLRTQPQIMERMSRLAPLDECGRICCPSQIDWLGQSDNNGLDKWNSSVNNLVFVHKEIY